MSVTGNLRGCTEEEVLNNFDVYNKDKNHIATLIRLIEIKGILVNSIKKVIDYHKNIDIHSYNDIIFRTAVFYERLDIVKYLIENKADIHTCNDEALKIAISKGNHELVKCIIERDKHFENSVSDLESNKDSIINHLTNHFNINPNKGLIRMTRTFHPVGQGAFYSEKLICNDEMFNVIYDCGSFNKKELSYNLSIYPVININILFISHFHNDHINGIKELSKNRKIDTVIIPYLDPIDKLILIGRYYSSQEEISPDDDYMNSIIDPKSLIPDARIIEINNDLNENEISINEFKNKDYINNGTKIQLYKDKDKKEWVLIPYNKRVNSEKKELFKSNLIKENILTKESDKINIDIIKNRISKIRKIYSDIFNNSEIDNHSSLALYSGLSFDNGLHYNATNNIPTNTCGCLYLGDTELKNKNEELLSYYENYKEGIGLIQIPHHGSKTGNNNSFWKNYPKRIGVFSYGTNNQYKHPDEDTLNTIANNNLTIMGVSELCNTKVVQECNF